jgi:tyrosyl-tRNA synthetase
LFGKSTADGLKALDGKTFLEVFEGVPQAQINAEAFAKGMDMIAALAGETQFLNSNGEARRALKEQSISVNKQKVDENYILSKEDLIGGQYILLQRGKKNYFILQIVS